MELLIPLVTLLVTLSAIIHIAFAGNAAPDRDIRNTDLIRGG